MKGAETSGEYRLKGASTARATADGQEVLAQLGLTSLQEVLDYRGGELVVTGGHRSVRRIRSTSGDLYLKQSHRGGTGSILRALLRGQGRGSSSGIEAQNYKRLSEMAVGHPEVLAWAEDVLALKERGSFILTRAARGEDLESFLLRSPNLQQLRAVMKVLAETIKSLADADVVFKDLVSKHIFLAEEASGAFQLELIDVQRCETLKPDTAILDMLTILDDEIPRSILSRGRRLAFLRVLEETVGLELLSAFLVATAANKQRRRWRRRQMMSREALQQTWQVGEEAQLFYRADVSPLISQLGLDARSEVNGPACVSKAKELGFEFIEGSDDDLREIIHGHIYLLGRIQMPALLARRVGRGSSSFILREKLAAPSLLEHLRRSLVVPNDLQDSLSSALRYILRGSFCPREGLFQAFGLDPQLGLLFWPAATPKKELSRAEFWQLIRDEIGALGHPRSEVESFLAGIDLGPRGLLGRRGEAGGSR